MKAVILAGGLGTRISEETSTRPKPMVEIGERPILWHIMKTYSAHGINDFVICCGYKGYMIKEYFANYFLHMSDVTFDMAQACVFLMQLPDNQFKPLLASDRNDGLPPLVNIGSGEDVTIKELAELIGSIVGYSGNLVFDSTKPDGTMRKLMDVSYIRSLG